MLTNIRARNFKSLKDVTLDLGPRNVLVGANMAGKSNAIDLFRFIYDMTFPRQPGSGALSNAVFARGGFGELLWKGGNEQLIEIALPGQQSTKRANCRGSIRSRSRERRTETSGL